MHDDPSIQTSKKDISETGYVKMLPLLECKLEVQDAFDKHNYKSTASWYDASNSMSHVKEEPVHSCDSNSRESYAVDQDIESETSPCISSDSSTSALCVACGYASSSAKEMWEHRFVCHAEKVHVCNICQEHFNCKKELSNHIMCHQINQPHTCQICGSLFRRKADLHNHLISHQIERPHKCSICGADFQRHSSLANHIKIHSYSPGRALLSSVNRVDTVIDRTPTSSASQNMTCVDLPWSTKGPIPSFGTLPSPSFSFQHFINSSLNPGSSQDNSFSCKVIPAKPSGAVSNNIDSVAELSSMELCLNQGQEDYQSKIACEETTGAHIISETIGPLPNINVPFSQSSVLRNQMPLTTDLQSSINCELNLNDSAYLAVKQIGSLYGIKIEESLMSSQQGEQIQHTECLQPIQTMVKSQSVIEKSHPSNISPMQLSSPLSCSKCDFSCLSVVDFQSHVCVLDDHWNSTLSIKDSSELLSNNLVLRGESPASQNRAASSHLQNSSLNKNKGTLLTQDSAVQNKQTLKHFCVECNKKFATKQKLFRHMWIHRKKQFTCETCGVVFAERVALDGHRLALHPPSFSAPFVCNECGKTFASRQSLWEHGRVHGNGGSGGASLLWCQECNKSFASRQGYQIHIRTHTGERPYGCRYCYKSFRDGGTLRKHERIHTGERPHACPLCSRAFNQKVVLREHVRWVHAEATASEPPFSCQVCSTVLGDREELCVHIVKHSDDLAAMARAAAKKVSTSDLGNGTGSFPQKTAQAVTPSEEIDSITISTLGERNMSFLNGSDSFQVSTGHGENLVDNQTTSQIVSHNTTVGYSFPSVMNDNSSHCVGILSNSMSTNVSDCFEQMKVINVSSIRKQTCFEGNNLLGCSSFNVLPLGKSIVKNTKPFDRLDIKPGIAFSDSITSQICELPEQKLPCHPTFAEQVVINV